MRPWRFHLAAMLALGATAPACEGCGPSSALTPTIALITPSADALDFADVPVGTQRTRTVTLRSSGNGPLSIHGVTVEGNSAYSARPNGMVPQTLAPGVSLSVEVTLAPTVLGPAMGSLVVSSSAENGSTLTITLSGNAVAALDCDDRNPCTDDALDPLAGECTHVPHVGDCSDGTACTENDFCVATTCVGIARVCMDQSTCTRDLCDAATGCVFIPDPSMCEDNNACTAEVCDPVDGCGHVTLPNGTPCAPLVGCAQVSLCRDGTCVNQPAVDGTPCTDFNLCTGPDSCQAGTCTGERILQDPTVVSVAPTFGGPGSVPLMLDGFHVLFATERGYTVAYSAISQQFQPTGGVDLVLVQLDRGVLRPLARLPLEDRRTPVMLRVDETHVVLATRGLPGQLFMDGWYYRWLDVETSGTPSITPRGELGVPSNTNMPNMAWLNGMVHVAQFTTTPVVVDFTNPDVPTSLFWLWNSVVVDVMAHPATSRLIITTPGAQGRVALDATNPLMPVAAAVQPPALEAYDGVLDGDLLVTRDACCTTQELTVANAVTFETLHTIPGARPLYGGMALAGHNLHLVEQSVFSPGHFELRTFGSVDLGPPAPIILPLGVGVDPGLAPAVAAQGSAIATAGGGASARVAVYGGGFYYPFTAPGHGAIQYLRRVGNSSVAYSGSAVNAVTVDNNGQAAFSAGGVMPQDPVLVRLAPNSWDGVVPSGNGRPRERSVLWPATVLDAQQPGNFPGAATVEATFPRGQWFRAGVLGLSVHWSLVGELNGPVYAVNLALSDGTVGQVLPTDQGPGNLGCFVSVFPQPDEDLLVLLTDTCGPTPLYQLHLLEVGPGTQTVLRASSVAGTFGDVLDVGATRDRVVALRGTAVTNGVQPYSGTRLLVMDVIAGDPVGTLGINGGVRTVPDIAGAAPTLNRVLAFAGNTVFFTGLNGITILDVGPQAPTVMGHIPTPEPPVDALFVDGRVHVATTHGVAVVEPPCPPPMP